MKRRVVLALGAAVSPPLLAACQGQSLTDGAGSESRHIATLWWIMFGLAAAVYAGVGGMVLAAVVKGRRRERRSGEGEVRGRDRDEAFIWVGGLAMPVVVLAILGVLTVTTTRELRRPGVDPVRITVTGRRWFWDAVYDGSGVKVANEIRVPVGRPIELTIESGDVIHSFWVPPLAGKVDAIPGQTNTLDFTVERPGTYEGHCAEFCGLEHARMGFAVVALDAQDYDRWLARRGADAGVTPTDEAAAQGQRVFEREACAGCHTIAGTTATGTQGPDLSDIGERSMLAARTFDNTPDNLAHWIADPDDDKPGTLMPPTQLSSTDLADLVAYLESLK